MTALDSEYLDTSKILLVEDEQDLLELLRYNLNREGFDTVTAMTGEDGLKQVRAESPDLILLDLMLPAMDGLEVCKTLKSRENTSQIPIIMLTARGEESDIVRGLELGADDYITKPFSPRILMARIRAVLRRSEAEMMTPKNKSNILEIGGISVDPDRHEVLSKGEPIEMTATEFKLLSLIMSKPGRVFTRQQIIETIHQGFAAVTDRSVDVQVVSLRRKLGDTGRNIETVRGVGYRFKE